MQKTHWSYLSLLLLAVLGAAGCDNKKKDAEESAQGENQEEAAIDNVPEEEADEAIAANTDGGGELLPDSLEVEDMPEDADEPVVEAGKMAEKNNQGAEVA